jgi:hypothetical protein
MLLAFAQKVKRSVSCRIRSRSFSLAFTLVGQFGERPWNAWQLQAALVSSNQ